MVKPLKKLLHLLWSVAVLTTLLALIWMSVPYAVSAWHVDRAAAPQPTVKAIAQLQAAVTAEPGNVKALRQLARLYLEADEPAPALSAAEEAARLAPHNPLIQLELGDVYDHLGQSEEAITQYEAGLVGDRGPQLTVNYLQQADQLWAAGDEEAAVAVWRDKVRGTGYGDLYANWRLAQYYTDDEDAAAPYREAVRYFSLKSIAPPPDSRLTKYQTQAILSVVEDGLWPRETLLNVVSYRVWQGKTKRTEALLKALTAAHPADPDLHFYRGEVYHRRGDWAAAEAAYRQVLELDPTYAQAYLRLGLVAEAKCELRTADCEYLAESVDWYEQYYESVPEDLFGVQRLVEVYGILGDFRSITVGQNLDLRINDHQIIADTLNLSVDDVELGPNLLANSSFELWENKHPQVWHYFNTAASQNSERDNASFTSGLDYLAGWERQSARIGGLWVKNISGKKTVQSGFRQQNLPIEDSKFYLVTMYYRTTRVTDNKIRVWFYGDVPVNSIWLPVTNNSWQRLVALGPKQTTSVTVKNIMVFLGTTGDLWIDNVEIRPFTLKKETSDSKNIVKSLPIIQIE